MRKNHQLYSVKCSIEYTRTDESKGGLVSVSVQQRRAKMKFISHNYVNNILEKKMLKQMSRCLMDGISFLE